ncbi:thymidylate kinase [Thiohalorhabdus denitrificans]|uniref:Thymidylate kinase n=1 Tax=Thiohalorhabdus denitrificans TaxID=381306 RepID=A0A0P9ENS9_9GAMM|nr:dTMP kinase [Thiohalorhabdus denitrificans]KPV40136.1 thymidylate kinase [Thiohalorhabdus denitrificans]SCY17329.1 dTMP kinase [Thiohalorhabdus denitrificans]
MPARSGRFITLEGIDGAGKTTAASYLAERLGEEGVEVVATREPGGTPLAESIRSLLKGTEGEGPTTDTETLLMFAARAQHLEQVIRPALQAGQWVLCDRFTDATYAYQGGGRGLSAERIRVLEHWVHGGFQPDRTLLFELSPREGLRRRAGEGGQSDRFEEEGTDFLRRVQATYRQRAEAEPERFQPIDAGGSWSEVAGALDAWLARELAQWRAGA